MIFQTTEDRIKKLEKRIDSLEKGTKKILLEMNESLITVTDVITKLQKENKEMKEEKNLNKKKEILISAKRHIEDEIKDLGPGIGIRETVRPLKDVIMENYEFIQNVAREGLQPSMNGLLRLVEKEGEISPRAAAAKLKVHELQIEKWSSTLKQEKLITIAEKNNRKYLCSVGQKAGN